MKCKKCNLDIPDKVSFCPYCGTVKDDHETRNARKSSSKTLILILLPVLAISVIAGIFLHGSKVKRTEEFRQSLQVIDDSTQGITYKSNKIYMDFERSFAENPGPVSGNYRSKALEVKQRADEAFNFVQYLEISLIKDSQGEATTAVRNNEIIPGEIIRTGTSSSVKNLMIGRNSDGRAYDLYAVLSSLRDFFIEITEGDNALTPLLKNAYYGRVIDNTNESPENSSETWVNSNFGEKSGGEAIIQLTLFKKDIRDTELLVLDYLFGEMNKKTESFQQ